MTGAWGVFAAAAGSLFVVVDPIGTAAAYAGMRPADHGRRPIAVASRATAIATVVLGVAGPLGARLLAAVGLEMAALRVAGGPLLPAMAWRVVDAGPEPRLGPGADPAVFPLAVPLLA